MRTLLHYLFFLCSFVSIASAQQFREKELKTEIREVTVFLNSAQIFESGTTQLSTGGTSLIIKNLPGYLDDKSIQVKGDGEFTILSVNHRLNYLDAGKRNKKIDSLQAIQHSLEKQISKAKARREVLQEKMSLLSVNKSIGGSTTGIPIAQLKQAIELFESEIQSIKDEEISIGATLKNLQEEKRMYDNQLKELVEQAIVPSGEIEIRVACETPGTAKFRISYLVSNAGWYPKYDIRVNSIEKPLQIVYKAEVFQNTGSDWKNVKLRFSNANPNQSGVVPELSPWNLTFAGYPQLYGAVSGVNVVAFGQARGRVLDSSGAGLPGVNVIAKGSTVGTATDADGNFSLTLPSGVNTLVFSFVGYETREVPVTQTPMTILMNEDVAQLQEVVTVGYGESKPIRIRGTSSIKHKALKPESRPLATRTIENQTTVEIEVAQPYSIKSNGEKLLVDLKTYDIEALYQYYAVPKLDKDAFLMARVIDWDKYNLLEGEANLYFEDSFVGRTILNARSLTDTLDISLGRDKNIIVGREKKEEFCRHRLIGSNAAETRAFNLTVRNKKSQAIKITIFDQLPVSMISDISVSNEELSGGSVESSSGKVTWELDLKPQQQKELLLSYEVKYPKRQKVVLE